MGSCEADLEGWPGVTVLVHYFALVDAHEPVESNH